MTRNNGQSDSDNKLAFHFWAPAFNPGIYKAAYELTQEYAGKGPGEIITFAGFVFDHLAKRFGEQVHEHPYRDDVNRGIINGLAAAGYQW